MTTKLIHITDLSGKDKYYFCFEFANSVVQQEINRFEYELLKDAEEAHYTNEVTKLKHKYKMLEQEQQNQ